MDTPIGFEGIILKTNYFNRETKAGGISALGLNDPTDALGGGAEKAQERASLLQPAKV